MEPAGAFSRMVLHSYQHGVYQNMFHLVWQTKYRYKMLRQEKYRAVMARILVDVAKRHQMEFFELGVMPDHVHALVSCRPDMSQAKALNLLKGASAHELFKEYPQMRLRYPKGHFWSPGKAGRTVGDVDQETVAEYVRRQAQQTSLKKFMA
ncbi:MAG: IS200/IS605 family transposase [Candidatus Diapherotrites archaeon]|nr:IS200/IS605 family transposase [Candidatus Diapherotrites archaeon]